MELTPRDSAVEAATPAEVPVDFANETAVEIPPPAMLVETSVEIFNAAELAAERVLDTVVESRAEGAVAEP